jgi:two-component system NtrC family sensor kinase
MAHTKKIGPEYRFNQTLLRLARLQVIDNGEVEECFKLINEAVSEALGVERSSIWFYNDDQSAIICNDLFELTTNSHTSGAVLLAKDFPGYFKFMKEERTLPANKARIDPATREFTDAYLKPLNIKSMLDAPIRINGRMLGVVCCEKIGKQKNWTMADQIFVGNITDIIARAIQARERIEAIIALEEMNQNLERVISRRTEELEEQRTRTANASKMAILGEMAGSIAHEINNPLAIILGSLNMMKKMDTSGELTNEIRDNILEDINATTWRIEKIVKGLRFFARDSSQDSFNKVTIGQILDNTLSLCREKFRIKGFEMIINVPNRDLVINCQPVSISQALLNLLGNSFDAEENKPERWVRIDCVEKNDGIEIRVTDSGSGIQNKIKEKIMVPFFTTKPVGKGTGLGLSIVKGIVEQHKGDFVLDDSKPNTSFVMKLPKLAS